MKLFTYLYLATILLLPIWASAQITTPVIKANFGVDADLRANFFNGFLSAGNDDWFNNGTGGPGQFMIDTTGAAFIVSRYASLPATRMQPFFRGMRYPQFSVVNNRLLIDGMFIRDHHGDDSTVFASGSNKNGMNPNQWSTPISQGIPDKNDILDMFMHVRRDGPNNNDSLWFFGGLSIDNTTGNRYFDFEMYQTDIIYNRPTLSFIGYGPDAGHTAWTFNGAGVITKVGDIIFTAEYGSSSLSMLEARIWVHQSALLTTPTAFSWGGSFDGATPGAVYGYANIVPKTAGNYYTGLQSVNNTWAGPFSIVFQNNAVGTTYSAKQFMEFSVNLSKLGLDPLVTINDPCAMPFRKILVKSRASTSFTAELKDFVGPFSFFRAPQVNLATNFPAMCLPSITDIWVTNALATSLYTWTTTNGTIVGDTVGAAITVSSPGTYIVRQELMDSCRSTYARDTVVITLNNNCTVLNSGIKNFKASSSSNNVLLSWEAQQYLQNEVFEIQKSIDGLNFESIAELTATIVNSYNYKDETIHLSPPLLWYRIKVRAANGKISYSSIQLIKTKAVADIRLWPNPVNNYLQILVPQSSMQEAEITVMNYNGSVILQKKYAIHNASIKLLVPESWSNGTYVVSVRQGDVVHRKKIVIQR